MLMFHNATVDCDADTAKIYEYALVDKFKHLGLPSDDVEFPLGGVTVNHMGGRAELKIPVPGHPAVIIDRIRASEPKQQTSGGRDVYLLTGASELLYMQGVDPEHGQVSFTITEWSAQSGTLA